MRRALLVACALACAACAAPLQPRAGQPPSGQPASGQTGPARILSVVAPLGSEVRCGLEPGQTGEHRLQGPAGVWILEAWGGGDPSLALLDPAGLELAQDDDGAHDLGARAARIVVRLDDPAGRRVRIRDRSSGAPRELSYRALRAEPLALRDGVARATLEPGGAGGWWSLELDRAATVVASVDSRAVDSRMGLALVSAEDGQERARGLEACRVALAPGRYAVQAPRGARALMVRVAPHAPQEPLQLLPGGSVEGALLPGEVATFLLVLRAPGPVELVARAGGVAALDPWLALEAEDGALVARDDDGGGQGAARLVRSLAAGRWWVRVGGRGAGRFAIEARPLGSRALPVPLRAGELVRASLAPRAWQWWRVRLPEGAWSFTARGAAQGALSLLRGRRQVAWSAEGAIERRLEAGEYLLGLADLSGGGGEWTVRARAVRGTRPEDPCALDPGGVAWRAELETKAVRWFSFAVDRPGPWWIEADAEGAEEAATVDVRVARADGTEVWGAEGCAVVALAPGPHLARIEPGEEARLACRAVPVQALAPERPARARLEPGALAVWRLDTGPGGLLRLEVEATCPAQLTLLDGRGRALTGQARFGAGTRSGSGPAQVAWVERRVHPGALLLRIEALERAGVATARATWLDPVGGQGPGEERWFAHLRLRPLPRVPVWLGRSSQGPGGVALADPLADPVHEPARSAFSPGDAWVGVEEVTQRAFEALLGRNPSRRKGPDLPVNCVTLGDALAYCRALTRRAQEDPAWRGWAFRLPTEEEWEAAARAGARTPIALPPGPPNKRGFDVRLEEVAWFQSHLPEGERAGPFPVALLAPNAWGLHDVHGNVAEWCLPGRDLPAPPQGHAPLRGGSWTTDYRGCRVSNRDLLPVGFASPAIGFRVVAVRR